ncbi:glycosyltransferase [Micromonospora sp. WMMA1363]|uniref:glycosyltransferase family 2 protein n=1 Tax=Micromonospora sp. WMMA1363 TaxID=3053985 RepID=UPI00259CC67F|nr:glycosyltransferase [Micromonospora sp. WMMA1363]MDM4721611.1 glycosyltransferase [Micromonospora sp. WMMA1363]
MKISVITPVHPPSIPYLADAYESLCAQELPDGWTWEWLVQEDGRSGKVAAALPDDSRVLSGTGKPGGPGTARNMAMARSSGELLRVLDADDRLTPGALAREIGILAGRAEVGWTTCSVLDLMPDGSTIGWQHADPPSGTLGQGDVLTYFRNNGYRLPVHPATLCIRHDLALALGGWMALPGGEDTGLLIAASVIADGYFIAEPGLLYRKHPDQITAQSDWAATEEWQLRMQLIESRAVALQSSFPVARA